MPTGRDRAATDVSGDELALVSLDDLLPEGPAPFDGDAWRFLSVAEFCDALVSGPDPRLRRRRGRPCKEPNARKAGYRKSEQWFRARRRRLNPVEACSHG
jgi:hypothetical protein